MTDAAGEAGTAVTAAERPLVVKEVSFSRETGVCHATLVNGLTLHHDRIEAEPAGRFRLVVAVAGGEIHERPDQAGLTQLAVAGWAQESARAAATGAAGNGPSAAAEGELHVSAAALPDHLRLSIEGPATAAIAAAELARALITAPIVTPNAFEAQQAEINKAVEKIASSRWGVIGTSMIGTIYPDDVRLKLPAAADLQRHTVHEAQAWLESILARGPVEAAIVGDVPLETALGPIAEALGATPERPQISPETFLDARTLAKPEGPIQTTVHAPTPDGRVVVVAGFLGADVGQVREFRALWVVARILEERIVARVTRQGPPLTDLEATCAPGAALPGFGMVFAAASATPANADALAEAMQAEVERLAAEPPTAEEVRRAAAAMGRSVTQLNADPAYWAEVLATSRLRGLDMDAMARGEDDYGSFGRSEIRRAIEAWNTETNRFVITVTP